MSIAARCTLSRIAYPFEPVCLRTRSDEKLNLPTFFIEIGNRLGREMKDIGEEHIVFARLAIALTDATKRWDIDRLQRFPLQAHALIAG